MSLHCQKKSWASPELTTHGTVENVTRGAATLKGFGGSDGMVLVMPDGSQTPIHTLGS